MQNHPVRPGICTCFRIFFTITRCNCGYEKVEMNRCFLVSTGALNADPYIVMEYHPYGSLKSYLEGSVLIDDLVRASGLFASAGLLQNPGISNVVTTMRSNASEISGDHLGIRNNSCGSEEYFDLPEIQVQEKKNVKVSQLTQWAYEIASAMTFLSRNKVTSEAVDSTLLSKTKVRNSSHFSGCALWLGFAEHFIKFK